MLATPIMQDGEGAKVAVAVVEFVRNDGVTRIAGDAHK